MWSRNFPRINCRAFPAHLRLSMPLLPAWPGLNLYDWPPRLIWVLRLDFICFFTLEFIRLLNHPKGFPLSGRKRRHRTIFTEAQLREVGALFFIFLITLNFHSASFKGNDFVCFLKLENKIWAYRRQTASTINSALQIHVLKLQLRRKCKKH